MFSMTMIMLITLLIAIIIMLISSFISKKAFYDREKTSPFECGFEPFNSSRMPFSLRFFLIAIIFLIFDVEIALMFPMINTLKINNLMHWSSTAMIFIIILIAGLMHEWNQGALEWSN